MEDWEKLAVKDKVTLAKWLFQPVRKPLIIKKKKRSHAEREISFAQIYGELLKKRRTFHKRRFGEYIDRLLNLLEKGNLIRRHQIENLYKMTLKWEKSDFNFGCLICKTLCTAIVGDYDQNQKFFLRFHERSTVQSTCAKMKSDAEKFWRIIIQSSLPSPVEVEK